MEKNIIYRKPYTLHLEPFFYTVYLIDLCFYLNQNGFKFSKALEHLENSIHITIFLKVISKAIILVKTCEPPLYRSLCL